MDLKQADLGLLLALDALLDEEAVTPAAQRLGISQPAMSAQLARLRRLFDDPLLTPSGRRLVATSRAAALKAPLKAALGDLEALVREGARFDPATTTASFRVIGTDYVHSVMASPLAARLQARAPSARLALLPADPGRIWNALEEGTADAAVVAALDVPEAKSRTVLKETFLMIQRKDHPRGRAPPTLDEFCALDHVLVSPEGGGFSGAADVALARLDRRRRVAVSVPSFLLAPPLVAASDFVCLLPRRLAEAASDIVDVSTPPLETPGFSLRMMWHARRHRDPAHEWLRGEIASAFRAVASADADRDAPTLRD